MALKLHFLNVGHGDCTLVEFPSGRLMMVDINICGGMDEDTKTEMLAEIKRVLPYSSPWQQALAQQSEYKKYEDLLVHPVSYLTNRLPGRDVFRFVATHPDMDHLSGLSDLRDSGVQIINFWDTPHSKSFTEEDFEGTRYKWEDWAAYEELRDPQTSSPKTLHLQRGSKGDFFDENHDGIYIWAPTDELIKQANDDEDWNHLSYVIAIVYGKTLVVLGGDASQEAWQNILDHHNGSLPKTTILKASHHGRDSGYHCDSVASMNPDHVIVSVGKKPSTDASNKYRQHAENGVYSTRYHGTILAVCDDQGNSTLFDSNLEVIS